MAKRISLREFQQDLTKRLAEMSGSGRRSALLAVTAGSENWLVDLSDAGEIIAAPSLTEVPLARNWFRGLANVRGNLYAITDMAQFFGIRQQPPTLTADSRILLAHDDFDLNAGFLVDGLAGLRNLGELKPLELVADVPDYVTARYEDQQHNQWEALDMARLLGKKEFLQVAA